jgi:uncharacterized membrane protein
VKIFIRLNFKTRNKVTIMAILNNAFVLRQFCNTNYNLYTKFTVASNLNIRIKFSKNQATVQKI